MSLNEDRSSHRRLVTADKRSGYNPEYGLQIFWFTGGIKKLHNQGIPSGDVQNDAASELQRDLLGG
tara:strand:+ start:591 stop:788 length:198 start_codon:yes stop_codon:yes gene_type:complete